MARHRLNNISEEKLSKRNLLISQSMSKTKEKRKTQECKVITTKIQVNKLSSKQIERATMLDRYVPTTQTCPCGAKNKFDLSERVYSCACGYVCDRDIHAANMMIRFGMLLNALLGTERTDFKPVENKTASALKGCKSSSVNQEAAN